MSYEYNVPYVDFVNENFDENDGADKFFDINSQLGNLSIGEKIPEAEEERVTLSSKSHDEVVAEERLSFVDNNEDKANICSDVEENKHNLSLINNCQVSPKRHEKTDVLGEITDTTQNIKNNKKRKSDASLRHNSKFISLAESVHRFQVGTPPRFHSSSSSRHNGMVKKKCVNMPRLLTIPQSPCLKTKGRSRPIDYPNAQEREEKEIEEVKSFKLQANPLNPKIFQTPKLGIRMPREPIVVEPFNLTEFKKKEVRKSSSPFVFKAKELPKAILEHPTGIPAKKKIPVTSPCTPSVLSRQKLKFEMLEKDSEGKLKVVTQDVYSTGVPRSASKPDTTVPKPFTFEERNKMILKQKGEKIRKDSEGKLKVVTQDAYNTGVLRSSSKPVTTVPKPFTFEERTKMILKQKEEKIKKILQEEKEARKFHANPLPNYVKKMAKHLDISQSTCKSSDSEENSKPVFRAQPATVLYKQPFVPKKSEQSSIAPSNIVLHTEQRSKQRAEFDAALKQHYDSIEEEMRLRKEKEERRAKEEEALLRQQTVIKANPIRHYKTIPGDVKASLTSPMSPRFVHKKQ